MKPINTFKVWTDKRSSTVGLLADSQSGEPLLILALRMSLSYPVMMLSPVINELVY